MLLHAAGTTSCFLLLLLGSVARTLHSRLGFGLWVATWRACAWAAGRVCGRRVCLDEAARRAGGRAAVVE